MGMGMGMGTGMGIILHSIKHSISAVSPRTSPTAVPVDISVVCENKGLAMIHKNLRMMTWCCFKGHTKTMTSYGDSTIGTHSGDDDGYGDGDGDGDGRAVRMTMERVPMFIVTLSLGLLNILLLSSDGALRNN